jgi:hypothetical protein
VKIVSVTSRGHPGERGRSFKEVRADGGYSSRRKAEKRVGAVGEAEQRYGWASFRR